MFSLKRTLLLVFIAIPCLGISGATLEMWISSFQDQVYYEKMAELYRKKTKDNLVVNVHSYGFREMPDKLAASFVTGKGTPDLVQLDETFFGVFLGKRTPFVDLTTRIKKSGLAKDLHPQRLDVFSYDGKTLGVPQSLSAMVLYYRRDLFKEFGIKPADVATWQSFQKTGEKLMKDRSQRFMALDGTHFDVLLRQKGFDLFDAKGKPLPNFEEAVELMEWLASLSEKQIAVMPDRGTIFDPVFFSGDLETGEVLCVMGADWYGLDLFQQFAPDMKGLWGILPLPAWTDDKGKPGPRTATFAGQGLMICNKSQKVDEAWKFIEFVMKDPDANAERFKQGNSFPAYLPSWKDKRLLEKHDYFDQSMGKVLVELSTEIPSLNVNPKRPQAIFLMQENYFGAVMFQAISARQALTEYREALSKE